MVYERFTKRTNLSVKEERIDKQKGKSRASHARAHIA